MLSQCIIEAMDKIKHTNDLATEEDVIKQVNAYLRKFKVSPKHYKIFDIDFEGRSLMIQIDESCGYIDRRVSKSNFEFINGTCFSIEFDVIDN